MKRNYLYCKSGTPADYIIDLDRVEFALYNKQSKSVKVQFFSGQIQTFEYANEQEAQRMYDLIVKAYQGENDL